MYPARFPGLMPFRGFVAVHVPAEPPLAALLDELGRLRADLKPVEPGQLHFTLSFLGSVPDDAQPALAAGMLEGARGVQPFDVALRGVGAFPSARRPRVVWAGVRDPKPLVELALRMREALAKAGFEGDDKDFRAHLTLARVKGERGPRRAGSPGPSPLGVDEIVRFLAIHGQDELPTIRVHETQLYKSTLGPKGPSYESLAVAPLEG